MIDRLLKFYHASNRGEILARKAYTLFLEGPQLAYLSRSLPRSIERQWLDSNARSVERRAKTVVSLTSYPPRFGTLHTVIKSLLLQSVSPELVVLYVARSERGQLPRSVEALQSDFFSVREWDNIKQYKKIIPALHEFPGYTIVTADDDILYPRDWFSGLESPDRGTKVLCHRAHKVRLRENGVTRNYYEWDINTRATDGLIFPVGYGGILYPPNTFDDRVLDMTQAFAACPTSDDIWLYWMAKLNSKVHERVPGRLVLPPVLGTQGVSLIATNRLSVGGNDDQIRRMIDRFGWFE